MAKTETIATLQPSVRLVVFKFWVRSELVPDFVPRLPINSFGAASTYNGVQVLPSTPDVWLAGLRTGLLNTKGDYVLRGARVADERTNLKRKFRNGKLVEIVEVKMNDVRFTFVHRRHLNDASPHENFVERFDQLVKVFVGLTRANLWMVEAYLNPYLNEGGTAGKKNSVLMLDCAGRKEAVQPDGKPVMEYEGGREKSLMPGHIGQGIGPKVSILNKASELKLVGKNVQLVTP